MRFKGGFLLPFLVLPFVSGCMGGGGGSSSQGPYEIAYILSENSSSGDGAVVEYALNPTNGSLYSGSQTVPTNGSVPISFLMAPGNSTAFILNNNSPSGDGSPQSGSVASYTISSTGLSGPNPSTPVATGPNPVNMGIDPGGKYLVVANHGTGTSTSPTGYVEVFSFSSNGSLTGLSTTGSPCQNPFRVVFAPHASGSSSDIVYIACSNPELGTASTSLSLYTCSITQLENGGCSLIATNSTISLVNLVLDPSSNYLVGPGFNSSLQGVLLVCNISASPTCSTPVTITNITLPSANVAFSGSGSTEEVYIGNYNSSSFNGAFASCTISSSSSCSSYTISENGPIAFATNSSQSFLYIVATQTSIPSPLTSSGAPSSGFLYPCPIPLSSPSTCSSSQTTGGWPVNISLDPSGNFLFVPTLSGSVSVFQVASSGTLTPLSSSTMSVSSPLVPFSVTVPSNP